MKIARTTFFKSSRSIKCSSRSLGMFVRLLSDMVLLMLLLCHDDDDDHDLHVCLSDRSLLLTTDALGK